MKKIIEAQIPEEKLNRLATVFIQAARIPLAGYEQRGAD